MSELHRVIAAAVEELVGRLRHADDCVSYPWASCTCIVRDTVEHVVLLLAADPHTEPAAETLQKVHIESILDRGRRKGARPSPRRG
jgi:hypothetical protein